MQMRMVRRERSRLFVLLEGVEMNGKQTAEYLIRREEIVKELQKKLGIAIQALSLIAAEQRPDGTYNRDREACGKLARETLEMVK